MSVDWPQAAGSQRWLKGIAGTLHSACRIVCFPYAGGSALIYRHWVEGLAPEAACAAVQLPGRGVRSREAPIGDMDTLVEALMPSLERVMDRPTIFVGYSSGALAAFECAVRIAARPAGRWLGHLMVLASAAPQVAPENGCAHQLPDDEFIACLRRLGGMPQEISENEELLRYFLPMLRADFAIGESYRGPTTKAVDVPVTAIGGTDDTTTSLGQLGLWRERTRAHFCQVHLPGGHFFLNEQHGAIMAMMKATTRALSGSLESVQINP